ncbi:hypothetical protein [Clostridium sp. ATCC 25772]|uniref:hypothetical protein n=1 Tax=Clostridium sp. ATCC 25772 TaxID=1676991 RepID=UPI000784DEC5|nr:hypothetical protein [Clostridium sp. ATCC 25772]
MSNNCIPNLLPSGCPTHDCSDIELESTILTPTGTSHRRHGEKKIKKIGEAKISGVIIDHVQIPEGFVEIKGIKRTPIINQCKIIDHMLIVEGYIIKDIKYATPIDPTIDTSRCRTYRNNLNDIIIKVPFSFASPLDRRIRLPRPEAREKRRFEYYNNTIEPCDKGFMGQSLCDGEEFESVTLFRPPFAELISWSIREGDILRKCDENCCEGELYSIFTEKIVLTLEFDIFKTEIERWHYSGEPDGKECYGVDDEAVEDDQLVEDDQE